MFYNLQIEKAITDDFSVTDGEIKAFQINSENVNIALDACKEYLDGAEREFNLLESDINSEITTYNLKTAAKVTAVAAGFMIAGGTLIHFQHNA